MPEKAIVEKGIQTREWIEEQAPLSYFVTQNFSHIRLE